MIYKFKTEGGMVNDTIRKRLDCLNEFYNYLVKIEISPNNDFIKNKRKEYKPSNKNKVSLTIKEVQNLYKKEFDKKYLNETKDLFVFICFTGLRWSDLEQFDYRFIRMKDNEWIYEFTPIKTEDSSSIECFIPLCEIVKEILKKYDLKLNKIIKTNQSFNENLKIVCKESGLFNDITRIKNKETQTYMYRYETITGHKGRDTFITNLIDNTPINEIMKYTGHTKVSTLMKYVDKSRKVNSNYVKIFDL
jgi:integrase